jgi:hypothetical protein
VGLPHFGQSVDFVVSMIFLRSAVFAILAIGEGFLLFGVSARTCKQLHAASTVRPPLALPLQTVHTCAEKAGLALLVYMRPASP